MDFQIILFLSILALVAGLVKGLTGFGFALVATALLTTIISPREAITMIIIPIMVSNFYLIKEIRLSKLISCFKKFRYFLLSSYIGVITGMLIIDFLNEEILKIFLGLVVLTYVMVKSGLITIKNKFNQKTKMHQIIMGSLSGALFGSTNAGVPYVAYIDSLELKKHTFVGLLSSLLFIASSIRVGLAYNLGFYGDLSNILTSALLIIPTLLGVYIGSRTRGKIDEKLLGKFVLLLLAIIGINLLIG